MNALEFPDAGKEDLSSYDRMLAALKKEGIEIEHQHEDTFSNELVTEGLEGLPEVWERELPHLVQEAKIFWAGYIVKDHFETDDVARVALQTHMLQEYPEYNEFQHQNKLRTNVQSNIFSGMRVLVRELDTNDIHTPRADAIRSIYESLPKIDEIAQGTTYRHYFLHISEAERLAIVEKFDTATHDFLALMTKPLAGN